MGKHSLLAPFLPGAVLKYTNITSIVPTANGIDVKAKGKVSRGSSSTYGNWSTNLSFSFNPTAKEVNGSGVYSISLDSLLSTSTGDLNLYKIASNYLDNVPLLNGSIGDTGDMAYADVKGDSFAFTWIPPLQPSHFPGDITNTLSINVSGQYNNVNTSAQGYAPIAPAYKPSINVVISSLTPGIPMIFGGIYDTTKSQQFWEDNVGITPLVLKSSTSKIFSFNLSFQSKALPNDGRVSCQGSDINKDGIVNINDLSVLAAHWNEVNCSQSNNFCSGADINKDGAVHIEDLSILAYHWKQACLSETTFTASLTPITTLAIISQNNQQLQGTITSLASESLTQKQCKNTCRTERDFSRGQCKSLSSPQKNQCQNKANDNYLTCTAFCNTL